MKKVGIFFMMVLLAAGTVFATGSKDADSGKKKIVIGALIRNLNETFVRDYADNLQKLADENNIELKLLDGNSLVATQLDQLNTLLTQGVKYFVIIPQDTSATEQMAKAINARGGGAAFSNIQPSVAALKVGSNFYFASSPETVAGDIQAQIAANYFKNYPDRAPGNVINMILIEGQLGHPAQVSRKKGLMEGLARRGYNVNLVAEDTANWQADQAQSKMDAWVAAHAGKFNLVIAQNDDMALGAIESLLTNKYTDDPADPTKDVDGDGTVLKVPVIGVDATETGVQSMKEHKMYATVLQDSVGQSSTAFELMYQCATTGSAIGYTTKAGLSAATKVTDEDPVTDPSILAQCYLVPFKAITRD
jgi:methyl-galactoside transport system substrate-binding protein